MILLILLVFYQFHGIYMDIICIDNSRSSNDVKQENNPNCMNVLYDNSIEPSGESIIVYSEC